MDSTPRGPTVVIIEDDADLLGSLKFAFETAGFVVDAYVSAEAFLDRPPQSNRYCMVLDHRLPGMDGLSLYDRLRKRGAAPPAVIITTPNTAVARRAAEAGVPIVEKPLLGDALATQVRDMLRAASGPA
ncbi:MAG TPA: response regulator [Caulobacteraceae bacterium]|jgi:FixJ family two-component response regulator|nr:response regulator [Caulobacteraceae bacterium]